MKIWGSIAELVSAKFRKNSQEITLKPNDTFTYSAASSVQLPAKTDAVLVASGDIVDEDIAAGAGIVDTKLATIATALKVSNSATTAASTNTASAIVARDGSGNFSAGTITAALSGNVTGNVSGTAGNVTGIVAKANGGTGADNSSVTFPTTGTLVTRDASETLLNKTTVSSTGLVTGALTLPAGTEAERPSPTAGMVRYNTDSSAFEGYASGAWSGIGGGGTVDRVSQASHGFVIGDVLYLNGATYTKALAAAENTAEVVGMVSRVVDSGTFEITLSGEVAGLTGLVAGDVYFLSAATTGLATNVEPAIIGQVSVPIGVASTTTTMYVAPKRGVVLGGTNARTQLNLVSAAATQIFDAASPSLYTAGELTGWVQLGTSQKFYFRAPFAQNGGSTDWNISPSYVGDTPPAGFSITMASSGVVTMTCPTFTGTGLVNYALNAPAVGATFPLEISAARITQDTIAEARLPSTFSSAKTFSSGLVLGGGGTQANLNWYEEGTWTPVMSGSITAGTGTYTTQAGYFTRIGRTVFVQCQIVWSAHTGSGFMYISLPYTASASLQYGMNIIDYANLTVTGTAFIQTRPSFASAVLTVSPATGGSVTTIPFDSAATVLFNLTYFV
jgi:hypothetical protein